MNPSTKDRTTTYYTLGTLFSLILAFVFVQITIPDHSAPRAQAQETIKVDWSRLNYVTNDWPKLTVRWDLDWWRRELTNDHSNLPSGMPGWSKDLVPQTGLWHSSSDTNSVELGYRSDGMVVWRKLPEARP